MASLYESHGYRGRHQQHEVELRTSTRRTGLTRDRLEDESTTERVRNDAYVQPARCAKCCCSKNSSVDIQNRPVVDT